jgi:hypothetical protein
VSCESRNQFIIRIEGLTVKEEASDLGIGMRMNTKKKRKKNDQRKASSVSEQEREMNNWRQELNPKFNLKARRFVSVFLDFQCWNVCRKENTFSSFLHILVLACN